MSSSRHANTASRGKKTPIYFDKVASNLESTSDRSTVPLEQLWGLDSGNCDFSANPRNTGKGPGLLDLPAEIRLEIYSHLDQRPSFAAERKEEDNVIDIANLLEWKRIPRCEMTARKSWSWILTHPIFFHEGIDLVLQDRKVIFRTPEGITAARMEGHLKSVQSVILELGHVSPHLARDALCRLKNLPNLRDIVIHVTPATYTHFRLRDSSAPSSFKALASVGLVFPEDEAIERQKAAERQAKKDGLERELREAQEEQAKWTPDPADISLFEELKALRLQMTITEIKTRLIDWRVAEIERLSGRVRDPNARLREERRERLRVQEERLRRDLGTR